MNSTLPLKILAKCAEVTRVIALMLFFTLPSVLHAVGFGNQQWTTIGSAGVVMTGGVTAAGTAAVLDDNFAVVRYNVVAVDGLFATDGPLITSTVMAARFLDPGNSSRVIVRLKKTNLATSATSTLLTIDSNTFASSNVYQTQSVSCGEGFDFARYAYHVEVTLSRTAANASAGIASMQIGKTDGCIAGAASN